MAIDVTPWAQQSSQEIDRLLDDLQVAIRCRCCPEGSLFTHLVEPERDAGPRRLTRADFLGLLAPHDIDAARGVA
jgi:hypothetical protein